MKKPIFYLVLFPLFFSQVIGSAMQSEIPEPDLTVHQIMDDTIEILQKKYNIHPCGIGMNGKFEYLEISFEVRRPLEKDEAREMLFDCADEFLKKINSNEKIRPYLKNYPFDLKNVGIVFFIKNIDRRDLFDPNISVSLTHHSGVVYFTNDPENTFRYKKTYKETHEEALKLVNEYRAKKISHN
ncbi:MAG: hypothetical protein K1000chlam2_00094 [Chlamydiae bacterium]|nr:hypothetical protein [Chlamydiota bacterium]